MWRGRRARLEIRFRKEYRFEPDHPHELLNCSPNAAIWCSSPRSAHMRASPGAYVELSRAEATRSSNPTRL